MGGEDLELDPPQVKVARELGINSLAVMLNNICRWVKVNYSQLIHLANLRLAC